MAARKPFVLGPVSMRCVGRGIRIPDALGIVDQYSGTTIEFGVLGPIRVCVDGRIVEIGGQRERVVLATLLLTPARSVSVDRLCDALWGDSPPASWGKVVQNVVLRLRKRIGSGTVARSGTGYLLVAEPDAIDAARFEGAVDEARQLAAIGAWDDVGASLHGALSLWRGDALPELETWPPGVVEATRLAELRRTAMEDWAAAELACGRAMAVAADLESMATEEPLRERRWELLALALYRSGRPAEALRVFQRARGNLADIGLEPAQALRDVERRMLAEDPDLLLAGPTLEPPTPPAPAAARLAAELQVSSPYPFVGRVAELAELEASWEGARVGRQVTALIGGPAGIGKSRLVQQFVTRRHADGANVFHGRCDSDAAVPYQPFIPVFEQIAGWLPPAERARHVDLFNDVQRAAPRLHRLVPGIGPIPEPGSDVGSDIEREQLLAAAVELLELAADMSPTILVFEDVHWAGPQTLALLRRIAVVPREHPLLVVITHRDEPSEIDEALERLLFELRRLEHARRISLTGMSASELDELVAGAPAELVEGSLREIADRIADYTGGNPFYACELLKHLTATDVAPPDAAGPAIGGVASGWAIPPTVRDAIVSRFGELSPLARSAIELGAIAGRRCDWRVLVRTVDEPEDALAAAFDELTDTTLIQPIAGPWLAFQFSHELVRDAVEGTMRPAAQARAHLRVARALAEVHAADHEPVLADLARHFTAAATLGDPGPAIEYSLRAAASSMRSFGHAEAIALVEPLVELTGERSPERLRVLLALGTARQRRGSHVAAREAFIEAFIVARSVHDDAAVVRAAMGFEQSSYMPGRDGRAAAGLMRAAIGLISDESPLALRADAAYARALALAGDARVAEEHFGPILTTARERGDMPSLAAALEAALSVTDQPWTVLERSRELLDVSDHTCDPWDRLFALTSKFRAEIELGRLSDAHATLDAHAAAVARGEFGFHRFVLHTHGSLLALVEGDLALAERLAEEGQRFADDGGEVGDGVYGVQMFLIRREQDRLHEVLPVARLVADRRSGTAGVWRPGLAALYAELGMLDETARLLDELSIDRFAVVPRDGVWPLCAALLADAALAVRDSASAAVLYRELLPLAGRNLMAGMTACLGPCDRHLGRLAMLQARHLDADDHLGRALEMADVGGSPLWRAQVALDLASLAAKLGDLDKSQAMVELAAELAARHRLTALARHAAELR